MRYPSLLIIIYLVYNCNFEASGVPSVELHRTRNMSILIQKITVIRHCYYTELVHNYSWDGAYCNCICWKKWWNRWEYKIHNFNKSETSAITELNNEKRNVHLNEKNNSEVNKYNQTQHEALLLPLGCSTNTRLQWNVLPQFGQWSASRTIIGSVTCTATEMCKPVSTKIMHILGPYLRRHSKSKTAVTNEWDTCRQVIIAPNAIQAQLPVHVAELQN